GQTFQTLTAEDGLANDVVYAVFQDQDESFWLGTVDGISRYRPSPPSPPGIVVDAVVADRRYEGVSELSVPSGKGLVAFEFHGMSFKTRKEAIVFRYRLKGHDEGWENTLDRRVEYQDLPVGQYTFEVLAVDRDLIYSTEPATVTLSVFYRPISSSVRISEVEIEDVFSSFYKSYGERSIGSALVSNDDPSPVDATVSLYIPDLMSRPSEQSLRLEAGGTQRVTFEAVLNERVLDLEGEIKAQAEVSLSCEIGGQTVSIKEPYNLTVHGRGALTWDHLGRAAAFVTPVDQHVSGFARGLSDVYRHQLKGRRIDGNIPSAMLLFEALSGYGIKYAQDASTPYSQIRADRSAVDHIQYPSELLQSLRGDCDDLTVLYCALLENLNIPTAFVDAPDHILMMFDSGVSNRRELGFSIDSDRYVERNGSFWIPVEVTKLGEGSFLDAWELGAQTCGLLDSDGKLAVTEVRSAWADFPYALPPIEGEVELPDAERFEQAFQKDVQGLRRMRDQYVQQHYIRPLMKDPNDHVRRMNLAKTHVEGEDYNNAIGFLMPLLNTDFKAEAYYLIGYCYAGQKDYKSAAEYIGKALEVEPDNSGYRHSLEMIKSQM
ncbi:MAG: triple tyrosine motif-containing protein, partial [Bacteroidetes bacterium]|nr:triple tyrosine motif-containing protein [Bacteroidota bacterium]